MAVTVTIVKTGVPSSSGSGGVGPQGEQGIQGVPGAQGGGVLGDVFALSQMQSNSTITLISLPGVTEMDSLGITSNPQLISVVAPDLETVTGGVEITGNPALEEVNLPKLSTALDVNVSDNKLTNPLNLGLLSVVTNAITIWANSDLSIVDLSSLESCGESLDIGGSPNLIDLSLPALTSVGRLSVHDLAILGSLDISSLTIAHSPIWDGISVINCPALTILNISPTNAIEFDFSGNALLEQWVDGILAACDSGGVSNGTLNLTGGTNSTPSGAGLTSKANLEGKGWAVTHN